MRIIGGARRGLKLVSVGAGDPAAYLRPTSDRVREAIFNLLMNGGYANPVAGARVLDLFAGTGALGLEALSRGAARVTFVDAGAAAARLLSANIALMDAGEVATFLRRDATRPGRSPGAAHDLVFLDPPYGQGLGEAALAACRSGGWIAPGALIVWEDAAPGSAKAAAVTSAPAGVTVLDRRRYGDTVVSILKSDDRAD